MSEGTELNLPVAGLLINLFGLPGLGTLIGGGRILHGVVQFVTVWVLFVATFTAVNLVTARSGPDASQALFPVAIVATVVGLGIWAWAVVGSCLRIGQVKRELTGATP